MNALYAIAGFAVGAILGILPGLHPNMVVALSSSLPIGGNPAYFFIPLAVSNIMFDSIPSSLFGVAEEGKEASLPESQRLAGMGMSWYASMKTARASLIGFIISSILFIPSMYIIPMLSGIVEPYTLYLLVAISGINMAMDGRDGFVLFFLSSLLGTFSFLLPADSRHLFLPLLTGLFGMPYLLLSISSKPPKQTKQVPLHDNTSGAKRGAVFGMISNLLPALGASQISFLASAMPMNFLSFSSSLAASSTVFSISTAISTGSARSGIAVPFREFPFLGTELFEIPLIVASTASLSYLAVSAMSWKVVKLLSKAGRYAGIAVVALIVMIVAATSGIYGITVLVASTSLGMLATTMKARRTQLLGSIIYPTILIYSGLYSF